MTPDTIAIRADRLAETLRLASALVLGVVHAELQSGGLIDRELLRLAGELRLDLAQYGNLREIIDATEEKFIEESISRSTLFGGGT